MWNRHRPIEQMKIEFASAAVPYLAGTVTGMRGRHNNLVLFYKNPTTAFIYLFGFSGERASYSNGRVRNR